MGFYTIRPAVDGSLGEMSEFEPGSNKRRLISFHLVLEDWLGDDLVTMTPGFAVTRHLADRLSRSGLSGFELKDMYLSISVEGTEAMRRKGTPIPDLVWIDLVGSPGVDDFSLAPDIPRMVVSDAALSLLQEFDIKRARIEEYPPAV